MWHTATFNRFLGTPFGTKSQAGTFGSGGFWSFVLCMLWRNFRRFFKARHVTVLTSQCLCPPTPATKKIKHFFFKPSETCLLFAPRLPKSRYTIRPYFFKRIAGQGLFVFAHSQPHGFCAGGEGGGVGGGGGGVLRRDRHGCHGDCDVGLP